MPIEDAAERRLHQHQGPTLSSEAERPHFADQFDQQTQSGRNLVASAVVDIERRADGCPFFHRELHLARSHQRGDQRFRCVHQASTTTQERKHDAAVVQQQSAGRVDYDMFLTSVEFPTIDAVVVVRSSMEDGGSGSGPRRCQVAHLVFLNVPAPCARR